MPRPIHDTGEYGVILAGGDRKTLEPGRNYAVNNDIYRFGRWVRTCRPAVFLYGVGNRVVHNRMHDAPHTAVLFWGNDHVLEFNEVHRVCTDTGDAGAFYIGRDWSQRGNVIRYNKLVKLENNLTEGDPGLIAPQTGAFRLKEDSRALKLGFKPIPFDKIGLYRDEYR